VSSRELDGRRVRDHVEQFPGDLRYENLPPAAVAARRADGVVLALPNGKAADFVAAIDALVPDTLIVDLSADHRFDDGWYYGLPELTRKRYAGQKRIGNPGCYATAMQLVIAPLRDELAAPPQCFGVSGYSGAGATPSDRNDPEKLRHNLMPYALVDHLHEREVTRQLGVPVEFMPHVAPHFRGITMTVNLWLLQSTGVDAVRARYEAYYAGEPLVRIVDEAPWVSRIAGCHHAEIGGFAVAPGGKRVVVVATLDNLLKGAATQTLQNINRAFGFDECTAIVDS
jgi:N-acetyl-gamma-glutamyl-phosphate reductase